MACVDSKALQAGDAANRLWCIAGVWTGAALLIRPDDGIIVVALGLALAALLFGSATRQRVMIAGLLFLLLCFCSAGSVDHQKLADLSSYPAAGTALCE